MRYLVVLLGFFLLLTGCDRVAETDPLPAPLAPPAPSTGESTAKIKAREKQRTEFLRLREAQVGKTFRELTLGETLYSEATVKAIDDLGVRILHKDGMANVKWDRIQPVAKDAWGFDPDMFAEAQVQENLRKENVAATRKVTQEAQAAQREEISKATRAIEIKRTIAEIERTTTTLKAHQKNKSTWEAKFREEDQKAAEIKASRSNPYVKNRYGGTVSSAMERKRKMADTMAGIASSQNRLNSLKKKLSSLHNSPP